MAQPIVSNGASYSQADGIIKLIDKSNVTNANAVYGSAKQYDSYFLRFCIGFRGFQTNYNDFETYFYVGNSVLDSIFVRIANNYTDAERNLTTTPNLYIQVFYRGTIIGNQTLFSPPDAFFRDFVLYVQPNKIRINYDDVLIFNENFTRLLADTNEDPKIFFSASSTGNSSNRELFIRDIIFKSIFDIDTPSIFESEVNINDMLICSKVGIGCMPMSDNQLNISGTINLNENSKMTAYNSSIFSIDNNGIPYLGLSIIYDPYYLLKSSKAPYIFSRLK